MLPKVASWLSWQVREAATHPWEARSSVVRDRRPCITGREGF